MKTKTKNKNKPLFKSEVALQEYAVRELKRVNRDMPIISNPHSSQRNISDKGMSQSHRRNYFSKVKGNNKKQGFQEGQSDLIACYPSMNADFPALSIELKTLPENPFREYRSTGELWIKCSADNEKVNHIHRQLSFIARMRNQGFAGIICAGKEQFDKVRSWYFYGHPKPLMGEYKFLDRDSHDTYIVEYIKSF